MTYATEAALIEALTDTAGAFHESQEQTYGHNGNAGATFRDCPHERCRTNAALLAIPPAPTTHQRSPEQDYDPTPICTFCGKAWDETGAYLPEYACPASPGQKAM